MRVIVKFDGSCTDTKYDGDLGAGFHAYYDNGEIIFEKSESIGIGTNNEAEYKSLILALKELIKRSLTENIMVLGDSKLVISQVNNKMSCRSGNLRPLLREVFVLLKHFKNIEFRHIPREQNSIADELARKGMKRTLVDYYNYRF